MPKRTIVTTNPKVIQKISSGKVLVKSMPSVSMANISVSPLNRTLRTLSATQIIKPSGFTKSSKNVATTLLENNEQLKSSSKSLTGTTPTTAVKVNVSQVTTINEASKTYF